MWETASIIVGKDFQVNPLEGFVLGGAFLMHDSALCFEAFEGGMNAVRNTVQWKDEFENLKASQDGSTVSIEEEADFAALRNLHAYQAEKLVDRSWKDPGDGSQIFLLDNHSLRKHLGKLIGQIAASHHWDIEKVAAVFSTQKNVPSGFPTEWRIEPFKLACILRCADAAHINNDRAPDFLLALIKRNGLSLSHWLAQNRLSAPDLDQSDSTGSALLFTSSVDFPESDSEAWFVAYDAIALLDKEIKACNALLEKRFGNTFQITQVRGAQSPEELSHFIKAHDWQPCSAKVHVGNLKAIVETLGGVNLYGTTGDHLEVVIRELLQNARDSIKARAIFDKDFEGKIIVSLQTDINTTWLTVSDNGIGMSERVLTGPLLDFGMSFWTSSLVQTEFPGLRASKFKSVGKFGIGFYSIFMISDEVVVSSKNWKSGLSEVKQLKFPNGFSLRPILSQSRSPEFTSSLSTQIKCKLKVGLIPEDLQIEIKTNRAGTNSFQVPFWSYVRTICGGLDVPVFQQKSDGSKKQLHFEPLSNEFEPLQWLKEISFADYHPNGVIIKEYIERNFQRLRPIFQDSKLLGYAAVNTQVDQGVQDFLSIRTVGGLASSVHNRGNDRFIGYIDASPNSAKREPAEFTAGPDVLHEWARKQLEELLSIDLNPFEKYTAASALSDFGTDPTPLAMIAVTNSNQSTKFVSVPELAALSQSQNIAFLYSDVGPSLIFENSGGVPITIANSVIITPLAGGNFRSIEIEDGRPKNNNSIIGCIFRQVEEDGHQPTISYITSVGKNNFGWTLHALLLSST